MDGKEPRKDNQDKINNGFSKLNDIGDKYGIDLSKIIEFIAKLVDQPPRDDQNENNPTIPRQNQIRINSTNDINGFFERKRKENWVVKNQPSDTSAAPLFKKIRVVLEQFSWVEKVRENVIYFIFLILKFDELFYFFSQ